jgi:hypothetical protein
VETFAPREDISVTQDQLTILQVDASAPPLIDTDVSFWAVRGQTREVEIRYQSVGLYPNGKCLRFVVPPQALQQRADGSPIANGDSVLISIHVVDASRYLFEFDPAGLRFDPLHPARIEVRHAWTAADANGDGIVDGKDASLKTRMAIWRQERPWDLWTRLPVSRFPDLQEIHANITGFTRFALASD